MEKTRWVWGTEGSQCVQDALSKGERVINWGEVAKVGKDQLSQAFIGNAEKFKFFPKCKGKWLESSAIRFPFLKVTDWPEANKLNGDKVKADS